MSTRRILDGQLLQDYLERRLAPAAEQRFEEALIDDPDLAEQVRLELALRDGLREVARRDGSRSPADRPPAYAAQPAPAMVQVRPPRWATWSAAAAAIAVVAALPLWQMTTTHAPSGDTPIVSLSSEAAATLTARAVQPNGSAAYLLPAAMTSDVTDDDAPPLRLRVPRETRDIVLELDPADAGYRHRLVLRSETRPGVSLVLDDTRLPDSDTTGFRLTTEQIAAGPFRAEIEREAADGSWVRERAFTLRADSGE